MHFCFFFQSLGLVGAFKILTWFGILPETLKIQEILTGTPPNPRLGIGDPDFHIVNADYIEKRIRYVFQDRAYLLQVIFNCGIHYFRIVDLVFYHCILLFYQALTHPSYTPNCITESYERLEFLGDALLGKLISVYYSFLFASNKEFSTTHARKPRVFKHAYHIR